MLGRAAAEGHVIVDSPEDADVLVVNTCAFIDAAREQSVDTILDLASRKAERDGRRLVVTGCMAERYGEELVREIPEIDSMVGTGALDSFTEAIDTGGGKIFSGSSHYLPSAMADRIVTEHDGSAYMKVSDGCDHECSFCVIPSFRGRHESRSIEDVAREAERLVDGGVCEVNLVAQDLSAYGRDQGIDEGLARLLHRLGRVSGLERVRCFYLYPSTLTDGALDAIRDVDNVVPYIDIPLQHADGEMLRRMRRARDTGQLHRLVERIRHRVPGASIRSAFILGFPGETEAAFENLVRFVEETRFDRIGAFVYSNEEGSGAYALDGEVDRDTAERRRDQLLALQEEISREKLAERVGGRERVLVGGLGEDGGWFGRAASQAPEIDGVTLFSDDDKAADEAVDEAGGGAPDDRLDPARRIGRMVDVEITAADAYDLFGVVADDA